MLTIFYRRHRFPPPVIQHAVWLYLRFTLSYRDVEDLLAKRELDISYETVRRWVLKFGPLIARKLRQRRGRPSDRWHLDEMVIRIAGEYLYLWRAVDDEGAVLDIWFSAAATRRRPLRAYVQTAQETRLRAEIADHRQPRFLRSSVPTAWLDLPSSAGATGEQPRRELPSASTTARAQGAALQISQVRPAIPQPARRRLQHL